ncbi:MAG: HesA/MoeB/ThiF family protein [Solirubrobacteraceae bacterium]
MSAEQRFARHMAFFGAEGQERISASTVTVVGLGGLGSHLVQQLVYLGVQRFTLIDADRVSTSNLNRLIGAVATDIGEWKVEIAARTITTIEPAAEIACQHRPFTGEDLSAIADADVIFGCVDEDPPRLDIVRSASAHAVAYVDLASDITPHGEFGGRIVFAKDGERCLSCLGELDQHALARARMSEEQRAADDAIYGIDRAALDDGGPSVVSVNGVVASLAVTEFLVWRTGLREPAGFLTYRGDLGTVGRRADPPREFCAYCMSGWGSALPAS